jgi:hypothetical protein
MQLAKYVLVSPAEASQEIMVFGVFSPPNLMAAGALLTSRTLVLVLMIGNHFGLAGVPVTILAELNAYRIYRRKIACADRTIR